MSWPAKEETLDSTDWSWFQQNSDGSFIDVDRFVAENPNVKVVMLRACWPNGAPDKSYAYYANTFRKYPDIVVIAYLWPNPLRSDQPARWTEALLTADEMPDAVMLDFELTFYQTDEVLTKNARESIAEAKKFDLPLVLYTRGNWWEQHIKDASIEQGETFIVAHYPYFLINGTWQQCIRHSDLHANLPIGNSFTPYLGRIKKSQAMGWQCSCKGRLAPYKKDVDLDSLITAMFIAWYGEDPWADTEPDPEPPPVGQPTVIEWTSNNPVTFVEKVG
jgi:hypothetical protein